MAHSEMAWAMLVNSSRPSLWPKIKDESKSTTK